MDYETFKSSAVASMQKHFGNHAAISLHPIIKNNDIQLDGLMIEDKSVNISPTIYLNYYYEDYLAGKPLDLIFDDIIASYQDNLPQSDLDLSFFTDFCQVKYQIIYKLIHYEQNQTLLKDVPYFRFLDLAVVFCCYLSDISTGNATILIHNHHLDFWKITKDCLYELAVKNTPILLPYELKSMGDTLKTLCPDFSLFSDHTDAPSDFPEMYVLTNTEKFYGASAILYLNVLSCLAASLNENLYIIPSSVHEALLLPQKHISQKEDLNCIIQDVNASHVLKEEILSDHAYCFQRNLGFITL